MIIVFFLYLNTKKIQAVSTGYATGNATGGTTCATIKYNCNTVVIKL